MHVHVWNAGGGWVPIQTFKEKKRANAQRLRRCYPPRRGGYRKGEPMMWTPALLLGVRASPQLRFALPSPPLRSGVYGCRRGHTFKDSM